MNLICDRTQEDVNLCRELRAKGYKKMTPQERTQWNAGLKGAYNTTDLNRVEGAVAALAGALKLAGYSAAVTVKTEWAMGETPTPGDMDRYLSNVEAIRGALAVMGTTPATPGGMAFLTFSEANDIEKILLDVDGLISKMGAAYFYAGEVFAGEV